MKKVKYADINNQQLIDIRSQFDYQAGYVKNSLNLNPSNFNKYAADFLSSAQPIVFIAGDNIGSVLEEVETAAREMGFTEIEGYLPITEIPDGELQKTATISAEQFLGQEDEYILLDVRNTDEITRPAPEKNLINIPLEDLSKDCASLDKSKEIYTLCGSGNRGTSAASYLSSRGYKTIVIEGGMKAVQEASGK